MPKVHEGRSSTIPKKFDGVAGVTARVAPVVVEGAASAINNPELNKLTRIKCFTSLTPLFWYRVGITRCNIRRNKRDLNDLCINYQILKMNIGNPQRPQTGFELRRQTVYSAEPMSKKNRLAGESSPYLQQHAMNPVDWYPWGSEALDKARRENRPIFLSIGYSACHWCHVMEHESFEDPSTAELLNRDFISIKVDREERPDIDHLYMGAVQAMTQHGGWPLSVFLTPDLKPFYGGTYFPPEDRQGMPSFKRILAGVSAAWKSKPADVMQTANQLTTALEEIQSGAQGLPPAEKLKPELLVSAAESLARSFDSAFGGLGSAPKFFHSMSFRFLLARYARTKDATALKLVTYTLDHITRGGIHDQLGGGFHRYSTDAQWLVPHFEKMLYDNALLSELYLEAFQATKHPSFAAIARTTIDYVLREMLSPEGLFFSTQDADSEGIEGKFYVWTPDEIMSALGTELGALFCQAYDITSEGNWEGNNIPRLKNDLSTFAATHPQGAEWVIDQLSIARRKLLALRSKRVWPGRDEKCLLSWNGLMLHSIALASQVLDDEPYLEVAQKAGERLLEVFTSPVKLSNGTRRLLHSRKDGKSKFNGYIDDYAFFLQALITLYESDFDPKWLDTAVEIADSLLDQFWEPSKATFFFTGKEHEALITRPKELQDGATPSGNSVAVTSLLRLSRLTGDRQYESVAVAAMEKIEPYLRLIPNGLSQMSIALDSYLCESKELVLIPGGDEEGCAEVLAAIRQTLLPGRVIAGPAKDGSLPAKVKLLENRGKREEELTLYVCEKFTCLAPLRGKEAILDEVRRWSQ